MQVDAERFEMREMHGHFRLAPDLQHLLDGVHQANGVRAFIALVGVVDAAAPGRFPGHRHHLVGLRKTLRRVEQPGGKPDSAVAHSLCDQRFHALEFGRRGRPCILAQHRLADGAEPDIADDVGADLLRLKLCLVGGDVGRAPAIDADEDGRNALHQPRRVHAPGRIGRADKVFRMSMNVDEAGRDNHAPRVDNSLCRGCAGVRADIDDLVAADRNIADERRLIATCVDRPAADDEIGGVGGGCSLVQDEANGHRGQQDREVLHFQNLRRGRRLVRAVRIIQCKFRIG